MPPLATRQTNKNKRDRITKRLFNTAVYSPKCINWVRNVDVIQISKSGVQLRCVSGNKLKKKKSPSRVFGRVIYSGTCLNMIARPL